MEVSMDPADFKHAVKIQVRFSDIDVLGHVSNTVYQSYYDYGKLKYVETVLEDISWEDLAIVGASINSLYIYSLKLIKVIV